MIFTGDSIESQLCAMQHYSIAQTQTRPQKSHFVSALWTNQELLDDAARAYGKTAGGPLVKLYQRIEDSPDFIDAPEVIVASIATLPTLVLQTATIEVDDALIEQTVALVVKALKR